MTYLHVLIYPVIYLVKFANQYSLKFFYLDHSNTIEYANNWKV